MHNSITPTHLSIIRKDLPELEDLKKILATYPHLFRLKELERVTHKNISFPIHALEIGSAPITAPTFILTGGVHGLERIGSRVILSYLQTFFSYMQWDESLHDLLSKVRFIVIPIVNPVGMFLNRRSNGNGVDLMRNAPIEADDGKQPFLLGGHRYSNRLPWYRGQVSVQDGTGMELEAKAMCDYILSVSEKAQMTIALDVHSGFGAMDRLWFPYARTTQPFPNLKEVYRIAHHLDHTLQHHIYKIEPQSLSYTTHGDLWDYIYDSHRAKNLNSLFLPLTLELGSWLWIKKNPIQLFSALGIFNPIKPHRMKRILRRHAPLIDFLLRATANNKNLFSQNSLLSDETAVKNAFHRWYQSKAS